jgi:hypothetical protein
MARFEFPFLRGQGKSEGVAGSDGQLLADLMHGKYYHAVEQGRVFSQSATPLGLAIPIYTGTALAGAMPVWNPIGSGVKVVPIRVTLGYGSGTADFGSVGLMARNGMGSVIGTGQQATAFAETVAVNGSLGLVNSIAGQGPSHTSRVKSSNAGTVTIAAGVAAEWVRTLASINLEAATGTAHGTMVPNFEFDGDVQVYPGTMIWLGATKASVALYASTIVWEEVPL